MGLYLCIFDGDDELEGVEVGSYEDFGVFRDTVRDRLEGGLAGSRFPVLMLHSDCDGAWSPNEAAVLQGELETIAGLLSREQPIPLEEGWKRTVARSVGIALNNLLACFFDVDGEPLLERLQDLCACSVRTNQPILFQ